MPEGGRRGGDIQLTLHISYCNCIRYPVGPAYRLVGAQYLQCMPVELSRLTALRKFVLGAAGLVYAIGLLLAPCTST